MDDQEVQKNPDIEGEVIPKSLLQNMSIYLYSNSDFDRALYLERKARELGLTKDELFARVNQFVKDRIRSKEKGPLLHYHKTTLDKFANIVLSGELLSRPILKEKYPDQQLSPSSSSDNVMMTRDIYNADGTLRKPGLLPHVAAWGEVAFVFSPSVMDLEGYDATGMYPTASEIPLRETLDTVLVRDEVKLAGVKQLLLDHGIEVPVRTETWWTNNVYPPHANEL